MLVEWQTPKVEETRTGAFCSALDLKNPAPRKERRARRAPSHDDAGFDAIAAATRSLTRQELNRRRALLRTAVTEDEAIPRTAVIVFGRLLNAANFTQHGYAFPGAAWIAEGGKGGRPVAIRTVRNSLERLEVHGYIAIKLRHARGVQTASWYAFPTLASGELPELSESAPKITSECKPACKPECKNGAPQSAIDVHPDMGIYASPKNSIQIPPTPKGGDDLAEAFAEFWNTYPRKAARIAAFNAYHLIVNGKPAPNDRTRLRPKAVERATVAELLDGAKRFAAECRKSRTELDKIPHPTTWLNAGRWLDGQPIKAAGSPDTVTNAGKFSYDRSRHPVEYAIWLEYCGRADAEPQYRRNLNLFEKHGFVLVDRAFPPKTEAEKKAEDQARFEENMRKLRAAPFNRSVSA